MRRSIAAVLAVLTVLNGLIMLLATPTWYESVPGVSETGPYNPHFVQDIGAAFLVAGLALAARAWRPVFPSRVPWPKSCCKKGRSVPEALLITWRSLTSSPWTSTGPLSLPPPSGFDRGRQRWRCLRPLSP